MSRKLWQRFEAELAAGRVNLAARDTTRAPDILDLSDGTAILRALTEPEPRRIHDSWLVLENNDGKGDCLFHALSGQDFDHKKLPALRRQVAAVRLRMPEDPRGNALRVIAALLQTSSTRNRGLELVAERIAGLTNRACAAMQSVPGMFAGEHEIEQWCILTRRTVVVVDENGSVRTITDGGQAEVSCTGRTVWPTIRKLLSGDVVGLFKTPGHWQRILRLRAR